MKCPKCNTENPQEAKFCRCCGYTISSESNIYTEKQRLQQENDRLKNEVRFFESSLTRERLKLRDEIENKEIKITEPTRELLLMYRRFENLMTDMVRYNDKGYDCDDILDSTSETIDKIKERLIDMITENISNCEEDVLTI